MRLGFVGLGKMGGNMVTRLLGAGNEVVVYDRGKQAVTGMEKQGAYPSSSLEELVESLKPPRIAWVMVPAGDATSTTITSLVSLMEEGDIIIDGGNSYYKDSVKHGSMCDKKGISFVDAGTSGGIWGLERGYCLMVGCKKQVFEYLEPVFRDLAPEDGYIHTGGEGSGHYVKMVHNGIEYGMLQAYAEGFALLEKSDYNLDLAGISRTWNHGSVIQSWLLYLAQGAFEDDPRLKTVKGYVEDSGEGRWTVLDSIEKDIPAPVISLSLMSRFESRLEDSFSAKFTAALRNKFGGHKIKKE